MSQLSKEWWKIKFPWLDETRRSLGAESETVLWVAQEATLHTLQGADISTSAQLQKVSEFFLFWLHSRLFFVIYSHPTQKSPVLRFLPPRCENTPISLWGSQTEFPLRPQGFSGGVGNVVRGVVGKCLLENCLICYSLLSPSGKSASLCYFGKFSEMIGKKRKKKISWTFSISITFLDCLKVGEEEGPWGEEIRWTGPLPSPLTGAGEMPSQSKDLSLGELLAQWRVWLA